MELPIKHCGNCRNSFTLPEFMALPLMRTGRSDNDRETQTRMCLCDGELTVATEYYLDRQAVGALTISHAQYARDFPRSARPPGSLPGHIVLTDEEGEAMGYEQMDPTLGGRLTRLTATKLLLYVATVAWFVAMIGGAVLIRWWFG